jgi:hypothetical protein
MTKIFEQFAETGQCKVNVKEVVKTWGKKSFISQWHNKYTLCTKDCKAEISKEQAKELIVMIDLFPEKSPIFNYAWTWKKIIIPD